MKKFVIINLLLGMIGSLFAIVGDFKSYGSALTLHDLHFNDGRILAASMGGLVEFDPETAEFNIITDLDYLDHISIDELYIHSDGSSWFSYETEPTAITVADLEKNVRHFELDFSSVNSFSGDSAYVFAAYMDGLTPGIVQFQKIGSNYVFKDYFNLFPNNPSEIHKILIYGDSLYVASDKGIFRGYKGSSNLKPESAWEILISDQDVIDMISGNDAMYVLTQDSVYVYAKNGFQPVYGSAESLNGLKEYGSDIYILSDHTIVRLEDEATIYSCSGQISDVLFEEDNLYLACTDKGLTVVDLTDGTELTYRPNTMLELYSSSLAMGAEGDVYVCGLEGVSILSDDSWHNLVFSKTDQALHSDYSQDYFSSDTLNIAYRTGGETAVYDAIVGSDQNLYFTITDISVIPVAGQSGTAEGPGAMTRINLQDFEDYQSYDTTDNMFHGTEELNGSAHYLKMSALAEGKNGEIWVLNPHTIEEEPLVKLYSSGNFRKYSVEQSNNTLQILPEDMVFDKYGRLWIANHQRQSDVPYTNGGITVYDILGGYWRLITMSDGLLSNDIISIDTDPTTGNIWVASPSGVQMIRLPSSIVETEEISMSPAIEGLSGKIPTKIRVDARGNKWILTESQGIQIYMSNSQWVNEGNGLTVDNSDILDNVVYDIEFDNSKGYVYCLTASGLSRYDSQWTEDRESIESLIAYPQPFQPELDPYIVIDGLADQSTVSFVTLGGRVVYAIQPDDDENMGKQIVWDGILENGNPLPRGVYLVLVNNYDGVKARIKIAVK